MGLSSILAIFSSLTALLPWLKRERRLTARIENGATSEVMHVYVYNAGVRGELLNSISLKDGTRVLDFSLLDRTVRLAPDTEARIDIDMERFVRAGWQYCGRLKSGTRVEVFTAATGRPHTSRLNHEVPLRSDYPGAIIESVVAAARKDAATQP
jgi:hypothetical protein